MAVCFRILPAHFLTDLHWDGWMGVAESPRALAGLIADPVQSNTKAFREKPESLVCRETLETH